MIAECFQLSLAIRLSIRVRTIKSATNMAPTDSAVPGMTAARPMSIRNETTPEQMSVITPVFTSTSSCATIPAIHASMNPSTVYTHSRMSSPQSIGCLPRPEAQCNKSLAPRRLTPAPYRRTVTRMSNPQLAAQFFVAAAVILAASRAVGWLGRFAWQPPVVGEMLAGLLLGPSLLGLLWPRAHAWLFPVELRPVIYTIAQAGLLLYMFLVGATFRLDMALARGKAAAAVSLAGIVAPFALGVVLATSMYGNKEIFVGGVTLIQAALYMGAAMSITAFPMLARIIEERGLVGTPIGVLALSAASIDDVLAWCVRAVVTASGGPGGAWIAGLEAVGGGIVYVAAVMFVLRPLLARALRPQDARGISPAALGLVLVLLFAGAWSTDAIGVHAVFGAFFFGLAIPPGVGGRLKSMLSPVTGGLLLPMFFVYSGVNTRVGLLRTWPLIGVAAIVLGAACIGKFFACAPAPRATGLRGR